MQEKSVQIIIAQQSDLAQYREHLMKILSRYTSAVLWESPCATMRETVVKAVAEKSNLCDANLRGADLRDADLCDADLRGANLCGADLRDADLCDADLRGANLCGADLRGANLCDADLRDADLCDADLCGANLRGANLCGADLRGANLRGANLCGADLCDANLCGAKNLTPLMLARLNIVPDTGEFTGWKICRNQVLVRLIIPANAKRSNANDRKCRAEFVRVEEVIGAEFGVSDYDSSVKYHPGEIVRCDKWNEDRWIECGGGIHFFISRVEAESYTL